MLSAPGGPVSHLTSRDRRGLAVQGDSDIITTMASEEQSKGTFERAQLGWQLGAGRGIWPNSQKPCHYAAAAASGDTTAPGLRTWGKGDGEGGPAALA